MFRLAVIILGISILGCQKSSESPNNPTPNPQEKAQNDYFFCDFGYFDRDGNVIEKTQQVVDNLDYAKFVDPQKIFDFDDDLSHVTIEIQTDPHTLNNEKILKTLRIIVRHKNKMNLSSPLPESYVSANTKQGSLYSSIYLGKAYDLRGVEVDRAAVSCSYAQKLSEDESI